MDTIIVGPMNHAGLTERFFHDLLGPSPIARGGVAYWPYVLQQGVVP